MVTFLLTLKVPVPNIPACESLERGTPGVSQIILLREKAGSSDLGIPS